MELPPDVVLGRAQFMIQLLLLVAFIAPIFASAFLVIFRGRGVNGRWLFLLVGPVVVYTVLWVLTLVFIAPAYFILVWFTPAVSELVNQKPYWWPLFAWISKYDGRLAGLLCAALTVWLVFRLWPRWPAVLSALVASPAERNTK